MADSRQESVWTNHAYEQWEENKTGHDFNDDYKLRVWMKEAGVRTVVDLGCGGSLWRKLFLGYDYTGIDQNAKMIEFAKKRFPEDTFFVSEGEKVPLENGSVDLVFTSAVLQHNLHPRKAEVVKEISRILKPNGYYMCTENTFREDNYRCTFKTGPWKENLDDGYSFTCMGWERFMGDFGFKMLKFSEPSEYLFQKA